MSGQESRLLGRWGESLAADYLRKQGYRLLAANWRCRFGEIDLIASDQSYLCFVEVKLRRSDVYGRGAEYVDANKQRKLRTSAELFLMKNPVQLQPRFDVIEIFAPQGMQTKDPEINHFLNAF